MSFCVALVVAKVMMEVLELEGSWVIKHRCVGMIQTRKITSWKTSLT
jgi:hypothetical protein